MRKPSRNQIGTFIVIAKVVDFLHQAFPPKEWGARKRKKGRELELEGNIGMAFERIDYFRHAVSFLKTNRGPSGGLFGKAAVNGGHAPRAQAKA